MEAPFHSLSDSPSQTGLQEPLVGQRQGEIGSLSSASPSTSPYPCFSFHLRTSCAGNEQHRSGRKEEGGVRCCEVTATANSSERVAPLLFDGSFH